jgi:hypothetical protein
MTQKTSRTIKESKKFTHRLADWEHGERPQGRVIATPRPEVDGALRPGGRIFPLEEVPQQPRLRQRNGVRVLVHLEDAEQPLHQGDDPPVVKVGEDAPRGQPAVCQVLQRGHERVQPRLV